MKKFLRYAAPLLATLVCGLSTAAAAEKLNVLFISIDDLRTSLGCYGDPLVQSPNIDRLAGSARLFERAYCHQAVCGPSRASILTGRLPDNTRVWHNRNHFREAHPSLVTLPQLFKNHGYHAQGLGKVFSGDEREEDPQSWSIPTVLRADGWSNYALPRNGRQGKKGRPWERADVPDEGYIDGKLARLAVETLEQLKERSQPFFLAVGFFKPHLPFNAPKRYWDLYDPAVFELAGEPQRTGGAPGVAYHDHRELGGYEGVPRDERVSAEQARDLRHGYYACISYVDAQVGKLLDAIERLDLEKNTIVVLWGDHGFALGEGARWCKGTNFELDTRVPLMIRTPGMARPGTASEALVEFVDIYPTLAELAGLAPPDGLDGRSLVPVLEDPRGPGRDLVLSQFARPFQPSEPEIMGYSIRTETHRYTRWIEWPGRTMLTEELYDYRDPTGTTGQGTLLIERENVAEEPAYAGMRERLSARMTEVLSRRTDVAATAPPASGGTKSKKNTQ